MKWVQIVLCPKCNMAKEVKMGQHRWKCPECKTKNGMEDTLWKRIAMDGE